MLDIFYKIRAYRRTIEDASHRTEQMKIANSIKTLKNRHKDCRVIRRKGRIFVINKTNPRFKVRQG